MLTDSPPPDRNRPDGSSASLAQLADSRLDPLFWPASRIGVPSAWYGHVPFAHWIVAAAAPRLLVELGTHCGVSYSAFCEAVIRAGTGTRCIAIDTWEGDPHAGHYGDVIFEDLRRFHDETYAAFSQMLRCRFDDALPYVLDESVDLLHIDGMHTYDAVRHDFECWAPKLSPRGVVLFHDTNVREREFGVWRLWAELSARYPHFEFLHGHGLGVLLVGPTPPAPLTALCAAAPEMIQQVRERFARLGAAPVAEERARLLQDELCAMASSLRDVEQRLRRATVALGRERSARRAAEERLRGMQSDVEALNVRVAGLMASSSWRMTAPLRAVSARLPRLVWREPPIGAAAQPEAAPPPARIALPPASSGPAAQQAFALPGAADRFAGRPALNVAYIAGEPDTPGLLYRVIREVEAARAVGATAEWLRPEQIDSCLATLRAVDLLVIWRAPWDERIGRAIEVARANKARVVFDIDDLMFEPELARLSIIDGIRSQGLTEAQVYDHYARVRATMAAADICTCTTEELAAHARAAGKPAMVLRNGFDQATLATARLALRQRQAVPGDGLVRLGYAGGSRTHQRDFGQAADAIVRVLHARPQCRLVLFRLMPWDTKLVDVEEFPALQALADRIEWRDMVPLADLPAEIVRFDINLAPLEAGNPFCETKSELKYFEAALAGVATVASPTGPFRRAIRDGETGLLASDTAAWEMALLRLVDDPGLRARMARDAYHDVLWRFGPQQRAAAMASFLADARGPGSAAAAFAADLLRDAAPPPPPVFLPETEIVWSEDRLEDAEVTVVIPLYNYTTYVTEALDSVAAQTLARLDLVVIDDCSTDDSLAVALAWAKDHRDRFNRLMVLRNRINAGLGPTRNAGVAAAETPFVLPLDADNRLLPDCAARCLDRIRESGAAFVYPQIRKFGESDEVIGTQGYHPANLVSGNYIDAMALVAKAAWAAVGGYENVRFGWEDYDFWCRLAEQGLWGIDAGAVLAEYRVHEQSMLNTVTDMAENRRKLVVDFERRHPWVRISSLEAAQIAVRQAGEDVAED